MPKLSTDRQTYRWTFRQETKQYAFWSFHLGALKLKRNVRTEQKCVFIWLLVKSHHNIRAAFAHDLDLWSWKVILSSWTTCSKFNDIFQCLISNVSQVYLLTFSVTLHLWLCNSKYKNQGVFLKHYAPGGNKVQKAIFSFKVKVMVTRSLTLVSFERASLVEYACHIWSLYLLRFKNYSEG